MEIEKPVETPVEEPIQEIEIEEISEEQVEETSIEEVPAEEQHEQAEFTLSISQLMNELNRELCKERYIDPWGYEECLYWLMDVQDNEAIVYCPRDDKHYGIPFSMDGDNVVLDYSNMVRKKTVYENWAEGSEEPAVSRIGEMMNGLAENFKADLEVAQTKAEQFDEIKPKFDAYVAAEALANEQAAKAKRDALFALMDDKLGEDAEYAALKANSEMDYSELETKCYALYGRKSAELYFLPSSQSTESEVQVVRYGVGGNPDTRKKKYGDLFERYGVRK